MSTLEDRLRRGLDSPLDVEPAAALLARVAAGARRRRQRRTAAVVAASIAVVAGSLVGVGLLARDNGPTQPSSSGPTNAPAGVVDIAVPDADHVFALTAGDGSAVWLWSDGAWQRLQRFARNVDYIEFAPDARNGWAWGDTLFSTHDGGHTWMPVRTGLHASSEGPSLTADRVWRIVRTEGLYDLLVSAPLGTDDWTSTRLPEQVNDLFTTSDRVVLEQMLSGSDSPRLLSSSDGENWSRLDFPCAGENQAYSAFRSVFVLCPQDGGARVYSTFGTSDWVGFGSSDLTSVTAVLPLSDDRLVLVGEPTDLLVTPSGSQPVDLGLRPGEEIFQGDFDTAGTTTYAVTSEHRILVTTDGGENWSALD